MNDIIVKRIFDNADNYKREKINAYMYNTVFQENAGRSGQVWEHVPRRHFAALTFLLHSLGLFRATARAYIRTNSKIHYMLLT